MHMHQAPPALCMPNVLSTAVPPVPCLLTVQPDGVQRGLVGDIIKRFEQRGYTLKGLKLMNVERALAEKHYADLSSKPFFGGLVDYICSGPVVAMVSTRHSQAAQQGKGACRSCWVCTGSTHACGRGSGMVLVCKHAASGRYSTACHSLPSTLQHVGVLLTCSRGSG